MSARLGAFVFVISCSVATAVTATCYRAEANETPTSNVGEGIHCEENCWEYIVYELDYVCKDSPVVKYCVADPDVPEYVTRYYECDGEGQECVEYDVVWSGSKLGYKSQTTLPQGWSPCTPNP